MATASPIESVGGVNTRDYNSNVFTNTIADTTFPWFDNGIGQRLDVREFDLPASFKNETVSDFIITQVDFADAAIFSGLTFGDVPYPAPTTDAGTHVYYAFWSGRRCAMPLYDGPDLADSDGKHSAFQMRSLEQAFAVALVERI